MFRNAVLDVIPAGNKSLVGEPSVANKDNLVFYTGNVYAARSFDGGRTWEFEDPHENMSEFCCDQDVVYDASRSIFLWYRQGYKDEDSGQNRIRLGVSSDTENWTFYDLHPYDLDPEWTGQWFDYPSLALSSNYLYVTTTTRQNVLGVDAFVNSLIVRFPLDLLKERSATLAFRYYFAGIPYVVFAPAQGATSVIYWATHVFTGSIRLYSWPESSTLVSMIDVAIPSFLSTRRGEATCPAPDGGDICSRTDDRILGGWVSDGVIGFLWNVKQGSGYPYPYIYMARFSESTKALLDTPVIWNSDYAWTYGWVSPNARGHLGLIAFAAGPGTYPSLNLGILDDLSPEPAPWEFYSVAVSTNGPATWCIDGKYNGCWGDYVRVRAYGGTGNVWVASGFTLEGGGDISRVTPRYFVFGRWRDNPLDFTLSNSGSIVAEQGSSGSTAITATLTYGPSQPVSLSCVDILPSGASCSFDLQSGSPTFTSTLTITASSSTPVGSFTVAVTGSGGGRTHTTQFTLTVVQPVTSDFYLSASPTSLSLTIPPSGYTYATSTVTVTSTNGWYWAVDLTTTWIGSIQGDITVSFDPPSVTPPADGIAQSTLTVTLGQNSYVGSYRLRVWGTSGLVVQTADISVVVNPPPPSAETWPEAVSPPFGFQVPTNYYKGTSRGYAPANQGGQGFWIVGDEISRSSLYDQSSDVYYVNPYSDRWVVAVVWNSQGDNNQQVRFAPSGTPNDYDRGWVTGCSGCKRMDIHAAKIWWGYPTSLSATPISSSQVTLAWTSNSNGMESNFHIERKTGLSATYVEIATAGKAVTSFVDMGLSALTAYYYRVRAYSEGYNAFTEYSSEVSATTPPNSQPLTTAVAFGSGTVSPDCPGGCLTEVGSTMSVSATPISGWSFSTWSVSGTSCSGGPFSNPCTFTMPDNPAVLQAYFADISPPTWPPGSSLLASYIGSTNITLTWSPATDNSGVVAYRVYSGVAVLTTVASTVRVYEVIGLTPGLTYSFEVEAGDEAGNWGSDGPSVTVTTDRPPVLDPFDSKNVNEEESLSFTAMANDPDGDPLTFTLGSDAPLGASITAGGMFGWTPTEAQGPGDYLLTIVVSDGVAADAEVVAITVTEVNKEPVLGTIGNKVSNEKSTLTFVAVAADSDLPTQALIFSLNPVPAGEFPEGASISPDGVFSWTPSEIQGPGTYIMRVTVSDGVATDFEDVTIVVNEVNDPPIASFSILPTSGDVPTVFTVNASLSSDPEDPIAVLEVRWDWESDGTWDTSWSTSKSAQHRYDAPGTYTITLEVRDSGGLSGSTSKQVSVSVQPLYLTVLVNPNYEVAPLEASFTSVVSGGVAPYTYNWVFGDGAASSLANPSHTYSVPGSYNATLVVTDSMGAQRQGTVSVVVLAPLVAFASADPVAGAAPLTVAFTAAASGGKPPYSFHWEFGDESTNELQNPSHVYQLPGTFTVELRVTDAEGRSTTSTIFITVKGAIGPESGPGMSPWLFYLAVPLVALGVAVVLMLGRRRRREPPARRTRDS